MISGQALIDHYRRYFFVLPANTPDLLNIAYRLRYKVYIEECGYQIGKNDLKEIEKDEYDDFSLHSLLFHKPSRQAIGYVRLIPFDEKNMGSLPLEKYCKKAFNDPSDLLKLRTPETGEISRMALLTSFRRRSYDTSVYGGDLNPQNEGIHNRFPINYLPVCLSLMGLNLMFSVNLQYSVAMMEKRLALLIKRFGIQHKQIGQHVEYHGVRAPYMIFTQKTHDHLNPEFKELFNIIHKELGLARTSTQIT